MGLPTAFGETTEISASIMPYERSLFSCKETTVRLRRQSANWPGFLPPRVSGEIVGKDTLMTWKVAFDAGFQIPDDRNAIPLVRYGALHGIVQRFVPHALSTFEGTPTAASEDFWPTSRSWMRPVIRAPSTVHALGCWPARLRTGLMDFRQLNAAASRPRPPVGDEGAGLLLA